MLIILKPTENTTKSLLDNVLSSLGQQLPRDNAVRILSKEPTEWRRGDSHRLLVNIVEQVFGTPATVDIHAFFKVAGYAWTVAPEVKLEIYPERAIAMLDYPDKCGSHQHHYSISRLFVHRHGREVDLCLISRSKEHDCDTELVLRPGRIVEDTAWSAPITTDTAPSDMLPNTLLAFNHRQCFAHIASRMSPTGRPLLRQCFHSPGCSLISF